MMKYCLALSRWIVGAVFIFSGFVKGIDPWGFQYKITDYLHAFGWDSLAWAAMPASYLLPFAEFIIGVGLLFSVLPRMASLLALLFMAYFTPLTLYLAIKNPVTDCGCFGDALIITNWQTFYKNVVLIVLAIVLFVFRKKLTPLFPAKIGQAGAALFTFAYVVLVFWSYRHEPIIDFRPYKVGVNIPEAMKIPEGAPTDLYSHSFFYKNLTTNEVKQFTETDYPWQDTLNWKFESMGEPILVSKGYTPPIHDFFIQMEDGTDVKDFFFDDPKFTFILVAYNLEKSSSKKQQQINELANKAKNAGMNFICLTSSTGTTLENFKQQHHPPYDFLFGDEITLKTIIRSNPGLLLTQKGTILAKWHYNDIPEIEAVQKKYTFQLTE